MFCVFFPIGLIGLIGLIAPIGLIALGFLRERLIGSLDAASRLSFRLASLGVFFSRLSRCLCCVSFVSFVDNRVRLPPRRDSFFLWIHPFVDARVSARSGRVCSAW